MYTVALHESLYCCCTLHAPKLACIENYSYMAIYVLLQWHLILPMQEKGKHLAMEFPKPYICNVTKYNMDG